MLCTVVVSHKLDFPMKIISIYLPCGSFGYVGLLRSVSEAYFHEFCSVTSRALCRSGLTGTVVHILEHTRTPLKAVRAALSDLLTDYMTGAKTGQKMDVQSAIDNLVSRNRELYGHLRRAAGDQSRDQLKLSCFLSFYKVT